MTVQTSIEAALFARAAGLVLSPALPVSWPNIAFTPVLTGYLSITHLPNVSRRLFLGSGDPHQRLGLLQVSVFTKLNAGASAATEIAGKVAEWFPTDHEMTSGGITVHVTKAPDVIQALRQDPFWHVPVRISYESFS